MCACTMLHTFFYEVKFYFRLSKLVAIPMWAKLCGDCHIASQLCIPWHVTLGWHELDRLDRLPQKVLFNRRLSSTKGCLPLKVVFHWRSSSTEGRLPQKVVSHQRSSPTKGRLPPKFVFHWRSSFTKGRIPPKVVFHWRSSSVNGRLPSKVFF